MTIKEFNRKLRTFIRLLVTRFKRSLLRIPRAGRVDILETTLRELYRVSDMVRESNLETRRAHASQFGNPLNACGFGVFSQADEDGITLRILEKLGLVTGSFLEIGVGSGTQCNTLILLASGWRGVWLGNEELRFPTTGTRLTFKQTWVTVENILSNCDSTFEVQKLARSDISVLSIDIDGNDLWVTAELLRSGFLPSLIIIEYNPLLPPPLTWARAYNPNNVPRGSNYGASLQYISNSLAGFGYFLAACALQNGNNAFFVHRRHKNLFSEVPDDISLTYVGRGLGSFKLPVSGKEWEPETIISLISMPQSPLM
jgi:hypothetical protein